MNVFCPKCETECPEEARFCLGCGYGLQEVASVQPAVVGPDTIPCPKCDRQIVPQWTYTGRQWAMSVGGIGGESHGKARMCPLCGVDIDEYMRQRHAASIPVQSLPHPTLWDRIIDRVRLFFLCAIIVVVLWRILSP